MNKFYMNGKLIHKASDHNTKRCEVEKWVFLPHSDFERLKANPYQRPHCSVSRSYDLHTEDKGQSYHKEATEQVRAGRYRPWQYEARQYRKERDFQVGCRN